MNQHQQLGKKVDGRPKYIQEIATHYCPGCHHGTVGRIMAEVTEDLGIAGKTILVTGVGCNYIGQLYYGLDSMDALHGKAPNIATGIKRAHYGQRYVITLQGDGDLAAIGMGDIINAVHRGEKLTTLLINNANYGMTGGQLAPTTILGQRTSTTSRGRAVEHEGYPAHMAELMSTLKGVAYSARVALTSVAHYNRAKKAIRTAIQKQVNNIGYGFVEVLSSCPSNWKKTPVEALEWINTVMMAEYPLGEFKNVENLD